MDTDTQQAAKREPLRWLVTERTHIAEQVPAMPAEPRRRSRLPSGWMPRGVVRHLILDGERVWFRADMAAVDGGQHLVLDQPT